MVTQKKSHQFVFINPYTLNAQEHYGYLYIIQDSSGTKEFNLPSDIHALGKSLWCFVVEPHSFLSFLESVAELS
jgi:hypothetical protein